MKKTILSLAVVLIFALTAFSPATKFVTKNGHISFFSHTPVEDITANNYKVAGTIDPTSGEVVFSVPMQSFEFEKALMQEHFNGKDFLNTKAFPKAKFQGKITDLPSIDFSKDGTYTASVSGELTLKDVAKPVSASGSITVKGSTITIDAKFPITLADYGIVFKKGKPSTNIAKSVDVTVKAEYQAE